MAGELADGFRTPKRLRKLRPPRRAATSAKTWGESPGSGAETKRPFGKKTMKRAKSLRMSVETVKRPTCRVKGQIGACELLHEARVARLAECRL